MTRRIRLAAAIPARLRVLLLSLLLSLLPAAWPAGGAHAMAVGDVAPGFTGTDLAGKPVDLSRLRGKLVLLNFWATWCAPCRAEMPAFSRWQQTYRARGLRVIGISMDDDDASVRKFLGERPVAYPVVMGDAALGERFGGVLGLPLSYLVDAQGRVVARYQGEADLAAMESRLRKLLPVHSGG